MRGSLASSSAIHGIELDVLECLVDREVVAREQDVPAARDVERHRATLAMVITDDEHRMRRPGRSTVPDVRAACATSTFHSAGGSTSNTPSAGLLPLTSRTTSPMTSIAEPARGSSMVKLTRVPTGNHSAGIEAHADVADVARVTTTNWPPSKGETVTFSSIRYRWCAA